MVYQQFTFQERCGIARWKRRGLSDSEIGRKLGRHRSSIGREVARNSDQQGRYCPVKAQQKVYFRKKKRPGLLLKKRRSWNLWPDRRVRCNGSLLTLRKPVRKKAKSGHGVSFRSTTKGIYFQGKGLFSPGLTHIGLYYSLHLFPRPTFLQWQGNFPPLLTGFALGDILKIQAKVPGKLQSRLSTYVKTIPVSGQKNDVPLLWMPLHSINGSGLERSYSLQGVLTNILCTFKIGGKHTKPLSA